MGDKLYSKSTLTVYILEKGKAKLLEKMWIFFDVCQLERLFLLFPGCQDLGEECNKNKNDIFWFLNAVADRNGQNLMAI